MFLFNLSTNELLAVDDDSGSGFNAEIQRTVSAPQIDSSQTLLDPLPSLPVMFRVMIVSYDAQFSGTTDLVVEYPNGATTTMVNRLRFGAQVVSSDWRAGDVVRTTGHYEGVPYSTVCEGELGGDWDEVQEECDNVPEERDGLRGKYICGLAYGQQALTLRHRDVFAEARKCEYSTPHKDTRIFAVKYWAKSQADASWTCPDELNGHCFETPNPDFMSRVTITGEDDDAGSGTNSLLAMDEDADSPFSTFLVGLDPWNVRFSERADPREPFETCGPSHGCELEGAECNEDTGLCEVSCTFDNDCNDAHGSDNYCGSGGTCQVFPGAGPNLIRLFSDNLSRYSDGDQDGLSNELESAVNARLGSAVLDDTSADSDDDGMIDGMELYGTYRFPLPGLGALPWRKDVVVELDGYSPGFKRIGLSYRAFDEAGLNVMIFSGRINDQRVYDPVAGQTVLRPVYPRFNVEYSLQPPRDIDCVDGGYDTSCDSSLFDQLLTESAFDLRAYPFVRRMLWTNETLRVCDSNFENCDSINGLAQTVDIPTGRVAVAGDGAGTFLHELGHLLGLGHGGHGDYARAYKPNYWSVMSFGVTLPHPEGIVELMTRAEKKLGEDQARARPVSFSSVKMVALDESALSEKEGIYDPDGDGEGNPLTFEDIAMDPDSDTTTYEDVVISGLDWDGDGEVGDGSQDIIVSEDQDTWACQSINGDVYENIHTGEQGSKAEVCLEVLQPANDTDYLQNGFDASGWASGPFLDQQRDLIRVVVAVIPR